MLAIKRRGMRLGALMTCVSMAFLFGCAAPTEVVYFPDVNENYYPGCCKTPVTPCKNRCMRACAPRTQCTGCCSYSRASSCCGVVYGTVDSGTVVIRSSGSSVWQQLFIN